MKDGKHNFRFLNADGRWPVFKWDGLELNDDGSLQLQTVPLLDGAELFDDDDQAPDGPAGIAVSRDGAIYFSDPVGHRVLRIDPCDGAIDPVRCMGGKGKRPAQFNTPRGLLIPANRDSLFVADSGNHRIQVFDLSSCQLVDIWGDNSSEPGVPSDEPGRFNTPWTLAGDRLGNVYVVDYGNKRVQKFNRAGEVIPSFWETVSQSGVMTKPVDIAVYSTDQETRVYVIDADQHTVFIFDEAGNLVRTPENNNASFGTDMLIKPMGIVASDNAVYAGDNERHAILKFKRGKSYKFIGEAIGYHAPVAALALLDEETLLVHSGGNLAPRRLSVRKGYRTKGAMWSSAISVSDVKTTWHRVEVEMRRLSAGAHLRLFVFTSDDEADAPAVDPTKDNPFADLKWRRPVTPADRVADLFDLFVGGEPSRFVWIGALFSGDGRSTPVISQIRLEFDHTSYLNHLPAIYRTDSQCADFLLRFLSLFEALFSDVEDEIEDLSLLFDPVSVPKDILPWLAGWLAVELDENWDEEKQRRTIAQAFELYGRRGTVEGLRDALRIFGGVNAIIEEPIVNAAWWSLPAQPSGCGCGCHNHSKEPSWEATENSILGVTTMLLPASAQGAVLGASATLDQSHLITNEEFGDPLFSDVAHQFSIQIYRTQLHCAETLPRVKAIIEREKPAHTDYHLCVIEPRMRVGYQARVGHDAVVGGPASEVMLHEGMMLDQQSSLGGELTGRVGEQSRIGIGTRVG
jgi:phage tail protein, P2 protein I family